MNPIDKKGAIKFFLKLLFLDKRDDFANRNERNPSIKKASTIINAMLDQLFVVGPQARDI